MYVLKYTHMCVLKYIWMFLHMCVLKYTHMCVLKHTRGCFAFASGSRVYMHACVRPLAQMSESRHK